MTMTSEDLTGILGDVRKAYRLLHEYHRRLNDLLQQVEETLSKKGLHFESWAPNNVAPLPKKQFFAPYKWAWDLTPAYQVECAWSSDRGKGEVHRIGLVAVADTGYDKAGDGEPDPAQFKNATECSTELWIAAWTTTAKAPDWKKAWEKVQRIPEYDDHKCHTVKIDADTYNYEYLRTVDVAALVNPDAVQEHLLRPIERWLDDGHTRR